MKIIESFCIPRNPNSSKNEDRIGYSDNFLFVIDGATQVFGEDINEECSDAEWFAKRLQEELLVRLNNIDCSIRSILQDTMTVLQKEFIDMVNSKDIKDYNFPSAGVLIYRINNNKLECYRLGDCLGLIRLKNGETRVLKEEALNKMDDLALSKQIEAAKTYKISIKEARRFVDSILANNRKKLNTTFGYWILEPTGVGISLGEYAEIDIKDIDSVSCMTDGYWGAVDTYKITKNYESLHEMLLNGRAKSILDTMFTMQEMDPDWNKYPRFKFRDDTSLIAAKF